VGNTGSYEKQALVLVNYGGATGAEVKKLAFAIIESVEKNLGYKLEAEVNMIFSCHSPKKKAVLSFRQEWLTT
jgi:UDP-N-acetylmuramate dehydrogenase